ncbi:MAG: hypothetical protein ACFE8A_11160 [Candidatus Hodarchaeota archaeon]
MRHKQVLILIVIVIMSSIVLNIQINTTKDSAKKIDDNQSIGMETLGKSDPFNPDPPTRPGMSWNFTTGEIVGWRFTSDWGVQDLIFNISDLKYFKDVENVTGNNQAYYGVQLTPAYWNVSQAKVLEFSNRTLFPLLNASLINYTLPLVFGMQIWNMAPFGDPNEVLGPESQLNPFIPHNSSKVMDLHWVANALHWRYSSHLKGAMPMSPAELVEKNVNLGTNSIHYSYSSLGTYCNLYYYDNGTLETGELKGMYGAQTYTINLTRIYDFNPLDDLIWSTDFDTKGDIIYVGIDKNETQLIFNHTVDNLDLEIEWDDDEEEWDIDLYYYQEIWANVSFWNEGAGDWEYENTTAVSSANEMAPIVFGGDDDDNGDDDGPMPPFLIIPDEGSSSLEVVFSWWEKNPYWTDLTFDYAENYVKITNTTTSKSVAFSYQANGILEYIYFSTIGPFKFENEDPYDDDLIWYYKNSTGPLAAKPVINSHQIYAFDLAISAVINISVNQMSNIWLAGFPYNPTNRSINNALGFFDIFIMDQTDLNQDHFAPINITFSYDHTKYTSVKVYWFNISANEGTGAWEQIIEVKDLGSGLFVVTLNHTSIIVFTASVIGIAPPRGDDDDDDAEAPIIPIGNYYLIFIAIAVIGLVLYKKRELFKK